jgi:hypothetical protein
MEIRNNSSTGGASERIDLTRANRDALSKTLATDVKPKKQGLPDELRTDATRVRVKNYREGMHERISNARDRFEARDAFRARVKNAREGLAARNAATDSVELSGPAQELADTAITARPSSVDSSTRAQRCRPPASRSDPPIPRLRPPTRAHEQSAAARLAVAPSTRDIDRNN